MRPITLEWINKAEGDWVTAQREVRARKKPNYDSACFHAQQCAEKYLKARLQESNIAFTKTHDLMNLLTAAVPAEPSLSGLHADLVVLTSFVVEFRYPGQWATKSDAQDAIKRCRNVRLVMRQSFGLTT